MSRPHQHGDVGGFRHQQDLEHLVADALAGKAGQLVGMVAAGGHGVRVGGRLTKKAVEAEKPEQPKHVLLDPVGGQTDEADIAVRQIADAVMGVVDVAIRRRRQRVDG